MTAQEAGMGRNLFEVDNDRGALLSDDGRYRFRLWRLWDDLAPVMVWVMLNPSTADADVDDPTIRKCIGFASAASPLSALRVATDEGGPPRRARGAVVTAQEIVQCVERMFGWAAVASRIAAGEITLPHHEDAEKAARDAGDAAAEAAHEARRLLRLTGQDESVENDHA